MIQESLNILMILLAAWVVLYIISRYLPFKKYGLDVSPLYMMYRTERLNKFLKKIATNNPQFWKIVSNIGVALAIGEIILAIYIFGKNLYNFFFIPEQAQAVFPVLPGITISFQWFPYFLIAAGFAITVHEISHGVVASLEGIPIKSSGIIIAPITFGGFVEPDDEIFNKSDLVKKLRLIAVGSLANLVVGILVTLIATSLFVPNQGVLVLNVQDGGPAYSGGMRPWEVIHEINGTKISNMVDMAQFMEGVKPGNFLKVRTSHGLREFWTEPSSHNTSKAIMGINYLNFLAMRIGEVSPYLTYQINLTIYWVQLIMISLAIFNMIPLFPLDGEAYIYAILKEKIKKPLKIMRFVINGFALSLIALNIALTFLNYGVTPI